MGSRVYQRRPRFTGPIGVHYWLRDLFCTIVDRSDSSTKHPSSDELKISDFDHAEVMNSTVDEGAARYYEEVVRLMNEIVVLLKENNLMLKEHNKTVEQLNERVRKIGINTSSM